jgi:hypothetical protein
LRVSTLSRRGSCGSIGLPLTIGAGCALAAGLFPEFSFGEALLLAIIVAPTDAALGQAVVTDPRQNDGICVPLLVIALAISDGDRAVRRLRMRVRVALRRRSATASSSARCAESRVACCSGSHASRSRS